MKYDDNENGRDQRGQPQQEHPQQEQQPLETVKPKRP